jgi:hypothetical protein
MVTATFLALHNQIHTNIPALFLSFTITSSCHPPLLETYLLISSLLGLQQMMDVLKFLHLWLL